MEENKIPKNPNGNIPKTNLPKFNLNWLYMIIALMLLGLYFTNDSATTSREVSYNEFQQYVRNGYVEKVVGYDDNTVEAYIKPRYVAQVFKNDSNNVGRSPFIITEAPSRESLGTFLEKESEEQHFDGATNYK